MWRYEHLKYSLQIAEYNRIIVTFIYMDIKYDPPYNIIIWQRTLQYLLHAVQIHSTVRLSSYLLLRVLFCCLLWFPSSYFSLLVFFSFFLSWVQVCVQVYLVYESQNHIANGVDTWKIYWLILNENGFHI